MFSVQHRRGNHRGRQAHPQENNLFSRQNHYSAPPQPNNPVQNIIKRFTNSGNISSLTNKTFGDLNKTLYNVQEVAKVVQSVTPIVQEYGPIVKNLPAMYRMVKAINEADDIKADNDQDTKAKKVNVAADNQSIRGSVTEKENRSYPAQSKPRLFF